MSWTRSFEVSTRPSSQDMWTIHATRTTRGSRQRCCTSAAREDKARRSSRQRELMLMSPRLCGFRSTLTQSPSTQTFMHRTASSSTVSRARSTASTPPHVIPRRMTNGWKRTPRGWHLVRGRRGLATTECHRQGIMQQSSHHGRTSQELTSRLTSRTARATSQGKNGVTHPSKRWIKGS